MKAAALAGGVYMALLARSVIGAALMLPVWLVAARGRSSRAALRLHGLRSAVVTGMALLFFWGLTRLPMAEAMALSFIAPLIALYLAAVLLGEKIQRAAVIASLSGLLGVSVIALARASEGGWEPRALDGVAAVLASAVLYAWNLILQRRQALVAHPVEVALFQNLFVALYLAPAAPWLAAWPGVAALHAGTLAAALGSVALMLLTWGYARAEAQRLVPIEYSGFIWAALFGWLWFGEAVTLATLGGTLLIVAGCWIAARRLRPLTNRPRTRIGRANENPVSAMQQ